MTGEACRPRRTKPTLTRKALYASLHHDDDEVLMALGNLRIKCSLGFLNVLYHQLELQYRSVTIDKTVSAVLAYLYKGEASRRYKYRLQTILHFWKLLTAWKALVCKLERNHRQRWKLRDGQLKRGPAKLKTDSRLRNSSCCKTAKLRHSANQYQQLCKKFLEPACVFRRPK